MNVEDLPFVSIIVIGYNEEVNLNEVFYGLLNMEYPKDRVELIYVDSGSTDRSVEIATRFTDKIFLETSIFPSAARNRNRGLIEASYDYCHFLDGDIIIDRNYLRNAVQKLNEGIVSCVFGGLDEKNPHGFGKILLHDYQIRKPGFIDSPGAGGTFIRNSLFLVNGWDERIPRGEETELGIRFREAGFKIWFLDEKMGTHDFGIKSISNFICKQIGEGISFGKVSLIKSKSSFFKEARKLLISNIFQHLVLILILISFSKLFSFALLLFLLFMLYGSFLFIKYYFIRQIRNINSLKYFFLINYTRSFVLIGSLIFFIKYLFYSTNVKNAFHEKVEILKEINRRKQK
jgi:glycosyltransferase involved in cell wall biosynthesis